MNKKYPVSGTKELDAFLSALPKNLQKGAYRAGLTAAARPVRDEARIQATKSSGKMARAIKSGSPRQNQDGTFSIQVRLDPKSPHAYLGVFAEYGVSAHLIARTGAGQGRVTVRRAAEGKGKVSAGVMKIGDEFRSGIIHHPGHAAHPFMRPALDAMADNAIKAFADRIRSYIEGKTGFAAPVPEDD
ncbi:HK97-gp10 family putative phage morphogenesis protein [Novosphingobium sp. ST904]|uniref:HK97-gp10 family putative phage morphogenesis protein n=1 Tax=Novosphingobium sp. ST904 TaxID=1684385 RepID=UPI000A4CFAC3|nr:HK97-gp10 family putative phage morphogenesis protein [Novosphingobium sp. ST904]TCM40101.1 HK97 gp10 family phage protein [Novosphingobium sp. ST904]